MAQVARLARGKIVDKADQLAEAMNGTVTSHHRFFIEAAS